MKKSIIIHFFLIVGLVACKNNGANTTNSKNTEAKTLASLVLKDIIVGAERKPSKPDFQVLEMSNKNDILTVVFRYSGGCEEHDFDAHFSGTWLKSMPPQAILDFEHLNPKNDACRALINDTVHFNLAPVKYGASGSVVIKYPQGKGIETTYQYTN